MDISTLRDKKAIEVYVDASAYYKGESLDVLENLRQIFLIAGLPEIRFVSTSQSMREQANSSSPSLLRSARAATGSHAAYPSTKPDTHFSRHFQHFESAHDYYFTPACRAYQEALINEVLPSTILESIQLVENLKSRSPNRSLTDICRDNVRKLKRDDIFPNESDENFSSVFRKKLKSVYDLAFIMQHQHAKNGYHELHHTHWEKVSDVRIVNPETGKIDDPLIIQSLALHPYFWKPVNEYMKENEVKHDSADKAILYYFLQTLQNKPDRDDRALIAITDDIKLRESFAAYATGNLNGDIIRLSDYKKPHIPTGTADHTVETILTFPSMVQELLRMVPSSLTNPVDGDPVVENKIDNITKSLKAIKAYGKLRSKNEEQFKSLDIPYSEILEARRESLGHKAQR